MTAITKTVDNLAVLKSRVDTISENTKSENTKIAYRTDWKMFDAWCTKNDMQAFPAHPETVALYIAHQNVLRRKPTTITRSLTSIRKYHTLRGILSPVDDRIKELLKGIKRLEGYNIMKKKPITLKILTRILEKNENDFIGIRNRALLLVGWTAALRRSELAALNVEDLEDDEAGIIITIRKSKTDQFGKGRRIGLPFVDFNDRFCAPYWLRKWLKVAQIKAGPIWRSIGHQHKGALLAPVSEKAIRSREVARIIKRLVKNGGFDPDGYSGHSMRAGLATTLAVAGIEERRIQDVTGHRSVEILRGYIRDGRVLVNHPIVEVFSN